MRSKRILACFFVFMIMAYLCTFVLKIGARAIEKISPSYHEQVKENLNAFGNAKVDYEKLYPFENGNVRSEKTESDISNKNDFIAKIHSFLKKIYFDLKESIPEDYSLIEAARKYEEVIDWNIATLNEYNPVVKLSDGYFTSFTSSNDVSKRRLEFVTNLAEYCNEIDTDFFYVNMPHKICKYEDKNISGILDFSNQNADRFLARLDEAGVKTYDMRKFLHDDGMKHHEAFFKTDHHWKPETGLWAAGKILKVLRDDYSWPVEPEILDPKNFDRVIYRDCVLGSQGKKVTLTRAKPEDITLFYPKFATDIHYEVPQHSLNVDGDFSVMYNMERLNYDFYFVLTMYHAYNYGDQPLTITLNKLNHSGKKILIIHDSFCDVVIPFLALGVSETYALDVRIFSGSVHNFIKRHSPDIVIVAYSTN